MADLTLTATMTGGDGLLRVDAAAIMRRVGQTLALQLAQATLDATEPHVPEDEGHLKQSGKVIPTSDGAEVQFTAPYAADVHDGTPPHLVPIDELRGWSARHSIPVWAVQHKIAEQGTAAQPFLTEGLDDARGSFDDYARQAGSDLRAALLGGS